jgi:hypothetical protein
MCFGLRKNTKLLSDHDCYTVALTNVVFCEIVLCFENTVGRNSVYTKHSMCCGSGYVFKSRVV